MYRFEALDDVQSTLQSLMERQPPLARMLPRQPGTKESRYMHLFAGDTVPPSDYVPRTNAATTPENTHDSARISVLESEVSSLKKEISELRQQLSAFQEQFK
jgi:uncharacterized protein YceH (UPF0502 family)